MNNLSKEIGERIKAERKANGLTQKQVAQKMFMTQQQYSRFENGVYELNYEQLIFISNLFDVSIDYLFGLKKF